MCQIGVVSFEPAVYILASRKKGVLYTGVTSNIKERVWQHKEGVTRGFTTRYGVKRLVYVCRYPTMDQAITREKQIKKWKRQWKIRLIEESNPDWDDLFEGLF